MRATMLQIFRIALPLLLLSSLSLGGCCNSEKKKKASEEAPALPPNPVALHEEQLAPNVTLKLHDGKEVSLSSLRDKYVLLYFYPKDNTPGCTAEAQDFRDNWEKLTAANVTVVGISMQDADSHKAFIEQEKLPFVLATDDGSVAKAFEVDIAESGLHARQSFLIGKDGKLVNVWRVVTPQGHATQVLEAIAVDQKKQEARQRETEKR